MGSTRARQWDGRISHVAKVRFFKGALAPGASGDLDKYSISMIDLKIPYSKDIDHTV